MKRDREQHEVPPHLGITETVWDKGKPPLRRAEIVELQQEEWKLETTFSVTHIWDKNRSPPIERKEMIEMQKKDKELMILRTWLENKNRGTLKWNREPKARISHWKYLIYTSLKRMAS